MSACKREGCENNARPFGYCERWCQRMEEEYQRGRDEERAAVVAWLSGIGAASVIMAKHSMAVNRSISLTMHILISKIEKGEHEARQMVTDICEGMWVQP